MSVFNLSVLKIGAVIAIVIAFLLLHAQNEHLKREVSELNELNEQTAKALEQANINIKEIGEQFEAGLIALNTLKTETKKEKVYVREVKERIIRDTNASCVDSINDIFRRLRETSTSSKSGY